MCLEIEEPPQSRHVSGGGVPDASAMMNSCKNWVCLGFGQFYYVDR